jgi:hypothetical protein
MRRPHRNRTRRRSLQLHDRRSAQIRDEQILRRSIEVRSVAVPGHLEHVVQRTRGTVMEIRRSCEHAEQGLCLDPRQRVASQWGLVELALPEVLGILAVDNAQSRGVLEKSGFLRIGEGVDGRSNASSCQRARPDRRSRRSSPPRHCPGCRPA